MLHHPLPDQPHNLAAMPSTMHSSRSLFLPPPPLPHRSSQPLSSLRYPNAAITCSSSTPCVVALTTAAVLALGSMHPRLLTPKARRTVMPMAVTAALVGGLVRPRRNEEGMKKGGIGVVRREEGVGEVGEGGKEFKGEGDGESGVGGVYSYSFKKSKKSETRGERGKEEEGMSGVFGYMREEFEREEFEREDGEGGEWGSGVEMESVGFREWESQRREWGGETVRKGFQKVERGVQERGGKGTDMEVGNAPGAVSVATVVRGVLWVPMWVMREVVVPVVEVVWWGWYELKVWLMAWGKKGKERYFGPAIRRPGERWSGAGENGWDREEVRDEEVWDEEEDRLTEEERQLRQMGKAVKRGVKTVEGGVRWMLGELWDATR